ncbi:hypothetical protein H0W91_01570 [Patescibacteria group bacterium]|nr:hypothetical protein [Patescibacteria group bacterium]
MKKNIIQDVIPAKKSIRNIEVPMRSRRVSDNLQEDSVEIEPKAERKIKTPRAQKIEKKDEEREIEQTKSIGKFNYEYDEPVKSSKKGLYIALTLFILAAAFGISALFKSAKITITPKNEIVAVNTSLIAKKNTTTDLGYQIVTLSKDLEKAVNATSEQQVDNKARGTIIIYNNAGSQPQRLVATTRFQTADGLIFRLLKDVSVPGNIVKDGKTVAGSIEVLVEADKTGASYNIGLKDFTIPGFKGDPKFSTIYARSKTEMTGGFSGMQKVVSNEDKAAADTELTANLQTALSNDIVSQIPSNFVLFPSSLKYKFDPVSQANGSNGGAVIRKRALATAIIFDKAALSKAIVSKNLPDAGDEVIKITNLDSLNFTYDPSIAFDPNTSATVSFNLKGDANLVWVLDENKLKMDLLGLPKKDALSVVGSFTTIKEAWIETHPFWNQTIPMDPSKVTLINTLTK